MSAPSCGQQCRSCITADLEVKGDSDPSAVPTVILLLQAGGMASGKNEKRKKKKKKIKGRNHKLPQTAWTGVKAAPPGHFRIISTAVAAAAAAVSRPVKGDMQLGSPH